jgi:hypothetical protein
LKENSSLKKLKIKRRKENFFDFKEIYKNLGKNDTIEELDLSHCSINDNEMKDLSLMIKKNKKINKLILNNNKIGEIGMKHFSFALKENSTLKLVNLNSNFIRNKGMRYFSEALKSNNTLEKIFLEKNWITNDGINRLIDCLKNFNYNLVVCKLQLPKIIDSKTNRIDVLNQYLFFNQKHKIYLKNIKFLLLLLKNSKYSVFSLLPRRLLIEHLFPYLNVHPGENEVYGEEFKSKEDRTNFIINIIFVLIILIFIYFLEKIKINYFN